MLQSEFEVRDQAHAPEYQSSRILSNDEIFEWLVPHGLHRNHTIPMGIPVLYRILRTIFRGYGDKCVSNDGAM